MNKKALITGITGQDGKYYEGLWRGFEFVTRKITSIERTVCERRIGE